MSERYRPRHFAWLWLGRRWQFGRFDHARVRGLALGPIYVEWWPR